MPIYEFKCLECEKFFEWLLVKSDDQVNLACPNCNSAEIERVLSATSYSMGSSSNSTSQVSTQNRTCSSGSCTTWNLPGHSR